MSSPAVRFVKYNIYYLSLNSILLIIKIYFLSIIRNQIDIITNIYHGLFTILDYLLLLIDLLDANLLVIIIPIRIRIPPTQKSQEKRSFNIISESITVKTGVR